MNNDVFMDKCRQLTSSIEVDHEKNLNAIRSRLSTENEEWDKEEWNIDMPKSKKVRKPLVAAAILAAVLSISTIAYATVPIIWRNIDATVSDGGQYVESLIAKISEDGYYGVVGGYFAEDSGRVVIDTDEGRTIFNDGLQPHDLEEALSILQLSNPALPTYLPDGFSVTAFAYPNNPDFNPYSILAMNHMSIMYSNENEDVIALIIHAYEDDFTPSASEENALTRIENYYIIETLDGENQLVLFDADNGILYRFSSSPNVDNSVLVRMAESMK